ncbi:MAG: hypothetical protein ACLQVD_05115 [Capsulimonadaceae bacterium]
MLIRKQSGETSGQWLKRLISGGHVTTQTVHIVLGVNPARVYEWQEGDMPDDAFRSLQKWLDDGQPQFPYWIQPV